MSKQNMEKTEKKAKAGVLHVLSSKDLGIDTTAKKISLAGVSQWVRALLQNWRQGTVGCKGRAEVAYTNRKPWKQKGTGRARAGSARSPLWRGGGVIFGPQPRTRTLRTTKNLRKQALLTLLLDALEHNKIIQLDWIFEGQTPKTSYAASLMSDAGIMGKKITLFLPVDDVLTYASFVNIHNVRIVFFDQPNAFELANNANWVVLKKDFDHFKQMVSQWI